MFVRSSSTRVCGGELRFLHSPTERMKQAEQKRRERIADVRISAGWLC